LRKIVLDAEVPVDAAVDTVTAAAEMEQSSKSPAHAIANAEALRAR
jgi:hypothetical protein